DDLAVLTLGHGVDGEIAPLQILLQGHLGRGLRREAAIAGRDLALAPRERVLLASLRMQEHRELAPHRQVTGALQLLRLRPDPHPPPALRAHLEQVRAAREFASGELRLPDSSSYRSYADIGRPYVVWNVVAAPEFSVSPQRWCFPIAGCVAYRGYFRERRARE